MYEREPATHPATLAPVVEINEQLIEWLRAAALIQSAHSHCASGLAAPAPSLPGRLRLQVLLREDWTLLHEAALRRLAECPCLLLDAGLAAPLHWQHLPLDGVRDAPPSEGYFGCQVGAAMLRRTLVFAWHLSRASRVSARVVLGMSAAVAERLAATRLRDLEAVAERNPVWMVPRWERSPRIWRQMIAIAIGGNESALRLMRLRTLQLLAAGLEP